MIIGIPREIKIHEYHIPLVPQAVGKIVLAGHRVMVEAGAGLGAGFEDDDYRQAGAEIAALASDGYLIADLIVKVKEPQEQECRMLRKGQILFAFLDLAANPLQTRLLVESNETCVAFETLADGEDRLPILSAMGEIAGCLATQAGATYLQREHGGRGVLLGGVTGVEPAQNCIPGP